jgi:hypothetical protein
MNQLQKAAFRVAVLIHEQIARCNGTGGAIYIPDYRWTHLQQLRRQIERAQSHGWPGAARELAKSMSYVLESFLREIQSVARDVQTRLQARKPPAPSDIFRDIMALEGEFEKVEFDWDKHEISVTTDSICLEGVELGPFEIRLDWQQIAHEGQPYRIVAVDPNPASSNREVTHPHVEGEQLCAGDGRLAIAAALAGGRVFDFFLLVSQVLHTYGEGRAYVELSKWTGVRCENCDNFVSSDDCFHCSRCDASMCDNCLERCGGCDSDFCSQCMGACDLCNESYCSGCLDTCRVCRKRVCESCLEEPALCEECHAEQQADSDDQPTGGVPAHACAAV